MLRKIPEIDQKCIECDQRALLRSQRIDNPYIYRCHANLTEAIIPIKSDDKIYGFFVIGQMIKKDDKELVIKTIENYKQSYPICEKDLQKAINKQTVFSSEKLESACNILQFNAKYLILTKKITLEKNKIAEQIEHYISNNLTEELSINCLCSKFSISKSTLCHIAKVYYGLGIAKYIKLTRIQKAKGLLLDTDLQICEISDCVGIDDYNYFTKMFASVVGMTPRQYRKTGYNC